MGAKSVPKPLGGSQLKKIRLAQDISVERCAAGHEAEASVVASAGLGAATGQAGFGAAEGADAGDVAATVRAMVMMAALDAARGGQRQGVAALFVGQTEVTARLPPFGSVRIDEAPGVPGVGHEVGEFMEEGPGQFRGKREEARIEQDDGAIEARQTGGGAQAGVPMQGDAGGEAREFKTQGPIARLVFHLPQDLGRMWGARLEGARRHGLDRVINDRVLVRFGHDAD